MPKNINDYLAAAKTASVLSAQILVVPTFEDYHSLIQFYTERGAEKIRVSDGVDANAAWLPMPDVVLAERLRERILAVKNGAIVIGLDGYLALLADPQRAEAFAILHQLIDENLSAIFLLTEQWNAELKNVFGNPRYQAGGKLVNLTATSGISIALPRVVLVGQRWLELKPPIFANFRAYLAKVEDSTFNETATIAMSADKPLAGVSRAIQQVLNLADFMRCFRGVAEKLSEEALTWIFEQTKTLKLDNGLDAARQTFGNLNKTSTLRTVLKRWNEHRDNAGREALLWFWRQSVPNDTYLSRVLSLTDLTADNFFNAYISDGVIAVINDRNLAAPEIEKFAAERHEALREIGADAHSAVVRFINDSRDLPIEKIAGWLNNDTRGEHTELIRRCAAIDLLAPLPTVILATYPALADYLAAFPDNNAELADYFNQYRALKLRDQITSKFCETAFAAKIPPAIQHRAAVLQKFSADPQTALLVVDALGAEYLPLLLALASRRKLTIAEHFITKAKLPTATEFNHFDWDAARKLPDIKNLDVLAHKGANEHEENNYALNLATALDEIFGDKILAAIIGALAKFSRVVLTGDHGASRLALLAHRQDLTQTLNNLPTDDKPNDWRYLAAPPGKTCPAELEESSDGRYWSVRGYHRLPKKGGKFNELHGGATLEEQLVPVVVFVNAQGAALLPAAPRGTSQLQEKDDFDL